MDEIIPGSNGTDGFVTSQLFASEIVGTSEDDILGGESGPDLIDGGLGNDTLTGGDGADVFVLAPEAGIDTINDFSSADLIGLSDGLTFDDLSFVGSSIIFGTETLAVLTDIDATTLIETDFTII
ncbi:MAG: hypothetical protein AB4372_04015 [Xenococcus sp. (in: cyanobacteria)]